MLPLALLCTGSFGHYDNCCLVHGASVEMARVMAADITSLWLQHIPYFLMDMTIHHKKVGIVQVSSHKCFPTYNSIANLTVELEFPHIILIPHRHYAFADQGLVSDFRIFVLKVSIGVMSYFSMSNL